MDTEKIRKWLYVEWIKDRRGVQRCVKEGAQVGLMKNNVSYALFNHSNRL